MIYTLINDIQRISVLKKQKWKVLISQERQENLNVRHVARGVKLTNLLAKLAR